MCTKKCNECDQDKPFSEFSKGRDANGLYYICKQCQTERSQQRYRLKDPLTRWVDTTTADVRGRAKRRGIKYTLTKEFLRSLYTNQHSKCVYCTNEFDLNGTQHDHKRSPSVDRLIPEHGYVEDNIVLCCHRCNTIKNDATLEELRLLTESLATLLARLPQQVN